MKYQAWKCKDSFEFSPEETPDYMKDRIELLWEVEANSWEEAMTKYHEYMGWEPYVPMDEEKIAEE